MVNEKNKKSLGEFKNRGFIALIAVILLATGTLAFSIAATSSAAEYADMVSRREMRIQAGLNATACRESIILMAAKDHFLSGDILIPEFGCVAAHP